MKMDYPSVEHPIIQYPRGPIPIGGRANPEMDEDNGFLGALNPKP